MISRGVGPKCRVGFRVWENKGLFTRMGQRDAEGNADCCGWSDQRGVNRQVGRQESKQAGKQAGRQAGEREDGGLVDRSWDRGGSS